MGAIMIEKNSDLNIQISSHQLVVAYFSSTWCNPCIRMDPVFEQLSEKFPQAVFLKIDVDVCREAAFAHKVSFLPTFIFFNNGERINKMIGENALRLEEKMNQFIYEASENVLTEVHTDLFPFMAYLEALNESESHPLMNCFEDDDSFLQSDSGGQLIISIFFKQAVNVHSIMIKAPETSGPKTIKFFTNQPNTLDFKKAQTNLPVQSIETNISDLASENEIPLQFDKFEDVQNLQIFVQDNHDESDVTRIDRLKIFGFPIPI